ncbi:UDP-4-amino-4,6-dideoxy-N-acetyl-beta-L-altrosamine transaminase [Gracilibacillus marinus]|uniref:UDP-4-amino-4, 6-dideoxy-N-acetyl-beta-L-altrosamine transaminase n=1 Tax=Gracilibacillus marinus TaxID=630535 RepID=A0ABV8VX89_9BACI
MKSRDTFLPYGKQWVDQVDIDEVVAVLQSDYLTTGTVIDQFEQRMAQYVGAKYAVAFANGTAALHGACVASGIKSGDEVITSPLTFAASANCVRYLDGKVIFSDIDHETYNLDPMLLEEKINHRTKAIITVDYTGQPCDYDKITPISKKNNLVLIADAAHGLGASYKGKKVGSLADMTMFSFHPVKSMTTGEGGIITTDSKVYYEKLKDFRSHGITRDPSRLQHSDKPWYYEMHSLGFNYRLTDIQAALGISQLSKLDSFIERRRQIAAKYTEALKSNPFIRTPYQLPNTSSSFHLYVIQLQTDKLQANRTEIFKKLIAANIGVNVHYIPVYYHPYYQQLGYKKGVCKQAEALYESILSLPIFPRMSDVDVADVIREVNRITNEVSM